MPRHHATNGSAPPERRLRSVQVVAEMYDVDHKTVRRWIASGLITGYRVGDRLVKIDLNEVEAKVLRPIPAAGAREPAPARTGR
jgi:excisionase family DNA binding protein